MNRAAETAAPTSPAGACQVPKKTRPTLSKTFSQKVKETMDKFDVGAKYDAVVGNAKSLPFAKRYIETNIIGHTTNKSLDGLFYILGKEEKKIRTTPIARSTDLLKKVFG